MNLSHNSFINTLRNMLNNILDSNTIQSYTYHCIFILILSIDVLLLMFMVSETSIYINEARGFFLNDSLHFNIANFGVNIIQSISNNPLLNDYGLRLPFIFIHIMNCILIYKIGLYTLHKKSDAILCTIIFMAIPGVSVEAVIVSNSSIITFICLIIIYSQEKYNKIRYELFIFVSFLDAGGSILCLALFFYALLKNKTKTLIFSIVCFGVNMFIFAPIHGIPQSYFIDTIGLMSIVFTPILFIYYIAVVYSCTFSKPPSLLNLIPFIGFVFILLLSTRQKINIESFLPQLSVGMPFFMQKVLFDIRCRLPSFRMRYILRLAVTIIFLFVGNVILFGNKIVYLFGEQKHNFAYSFYEAKDVAKELHNKNILNIEIPNKDLALRLRFYGINAKENAQPKYRLQPSANGEIKIIYFGKIVAQYDIKPIK